MITIRSVINMFSQNCAYLWYVIKTIFSGKYNVIIKQEL
jgi:hypothetical protein